VSQSVTVVQLAPDPQQRFQLLRRELGVQSFGINLITLQPRQRGRVHSHERQEEVYLVLEGELTLLLQGEQRKLQPNQIVRVAPQVRRQLLNAGATPVVVLALGGAGEHQSRDGLAWESWQEAGPGRPPQEVPLPDDLPTEDMLREDWPREDLPRV
jgi:mannose-6-phosphate isomerase-like protein (cupin superfamily)